MDKNLLEVLKNYELFIDTCSLMNNNYDFFEKLLIPTLEFQKKKIYILDSVLYELNNNLLFDDKKSKAEYGLKVIEEMTTKNLVENITFVEKNHADHQFLKTILDFSKKRPVCLITEDKSLAKDILINIKGFDSTTIKNDITAIKVGLKEPKIWKISELEEKLKLNENDNYHMLTKNNNHKMLISIIVDNSSSMKGDKITALKLAIQNFDNNIKQSQINKYLEYEIIAFDGFNSKIIKSYKDSDYNVEAVTITGIPMLGKSIDLALDGLEQRITEINQIGYQIYKPWLILLSDGINFGDISKQLDRIMNLYTNGRVSYFPFALSSNDFDDTLIQLRKFKRPLTVLDAKYDHLFKWLFDTLKMRIETPITQTFTLDINAFNGWIRK